MVSDCPQVVKRVIEKKQEEEDMVYPGLTCFKDGVRQIPIESIPGVSEAGFKAAIWYDQLAECLFLCLFFIGA